MLKSIDVLIGLAVIMLALSMAVTMITQFVTTILNSRGRHLKRGLVDLLGQVDPALRSEVAGRIAEAVLTHPLISASGRRLGSVVHREELTMLLLDLAGPEGRLENDAKQTLRSALARNGIADPEGTLQKVRALSLQLEAGNPLLAASVRHTMAILQEARVDYTAKINNWFDATIDRVAQRFTASTRAITFAGALLVAALLQVDTVNLVNRLAADDTLRQAFVAQAAAAYGSATPSPPAAGGAETQSGGIEREYLAFLAENGVIAIPQSGRDWAQRWSVVNLGGVLVTSLLLSLGAPFWYNALGKLLQLRSVLAAKDDVQRKARQVSGTDDAPASVRSGDVSGERGDLAAVG
jgi:hypothetical protein